MVENMKLAGSYSFNKGQEVVLKYIQVNDHLPIYNQKGNIND